LVPGFAAGSRQEFWLRNHHAAAASAVISPFPIYVSGRWLSRSSKIEPSLQYARVAEAPGFVEAARLNDDLALTSMAASVEL
jgi:hypothetical protein